MTRPTPVQAANAMEGGLSRRLPRVRARLLEALVGREGPTRMPHAIAWRLRERIHAVPPRVTVFAAAGRGGPAARRVLMVGNDLSRSGGPQLLVEMAGLLVAAGAHVTCVSPADGPLRTAMLDAGADVIVDPAIRDARAPLFAALAGSADAVVCNTVDTAAAVVALAPSIPVIWYLHEVSLLADRLESDPAAPAALAAAARVWAGSGLPAALVRPVRPDVAVLPYGLAPVAGDRRPAGAGRPLRLVVLASFEPRKGQDLLLEALDLLSPAARAAVTVDLYGRTLFPDFHAGLVARAAEMPAVRLHPPLDAAELREVLLGCDAVVVPSRDDTLPLCSLDALGAARVLICTRTTGTAAWLDNGRSGFVANAPTAAAIAGSLEEAIARAGDWPAIGAAGRSVFDAAFSRPAFAAAIERELEALTQRR